MKKGHRRTQSAYIASSSQIIENDCIKKPSVNQIFKFLEASNNKVESKVVSYEKLELNNDVQSNYLTFGNYTLRKYNKDSQNSKQLRKKDRVEQKLLCIPQTNRSSQLSSQNKEAGSKQDDLPTQPIIKLRTKRASDFPNFQNSKHIKTNSSVQEPTHRAKNKLLRNNNNNHNHKK